MKVWTFAAEALEVLSNNKELICVKTLQPTKKYNKELGIVCYGDHNKETIYKAMEMNKDLTNLNKTNFLTLKELNPQWVNRYCPATYDVNDSRYMIIQIDVKDLEQAELKAYI